MDSGKFYAPPSGIGRVLKSSSPPDIGRRQNLIGNHTLKKREIEAGIIRSQPLESHFDIAALAGAKREIETRGTIRPVGKFCKGGCFETPSAAGVQIERRCRLV